MYTLQANVLSSENNPVGLPSVVPLHLVFEKGPIELVGVLDKHQIERTRLHLAYPKVE